MASQPRNFSFFFNTRLHFGAGSRHQVLGILEQNQWKRLALVVDHNLLEVDLVRSFVEQLENHCEVTRTSCSISEPTYDVLDQTRRAFESSEPQVFLGIGGGSAMDMAKAMAVLVRNRLPAIQYRGFDRMTEAVLPVIAIPTTAGTGSEITPNASFIDAAEQRKMGINGEAIRPRYAFVDPELTLSCPLRPSVSAGADSTVHAVEAFVAKESNPMSRLFAREGFGRVFNNLPKLMADLNNLAVRTEVMYGALLSAVGLMNSGAGPAAAMSYPLGVRFRVPHGIAGALFLPHVARHNVEAGVDDYADLYQAMAGSDLSLSRTRQAELFVERMLEVWRQLDMPSSLVVLGVTPTAVADLVRDTMELKGALEQNPVCFAEREIEGVLRALL